MKKQTELTKIVPLVGPRMDIACMYATYQYDAVNIAMVKQLASKYQSIRHARPQGDCFFRAFTYAYLEYLVWNQEEFDKFLEYTEISREKLKKAGFDSICWKEYYESFMELISNVNPKADGTSKALAKLNDLFGIADQGSTALHVIQYLRLIVYCQPKQPDINCERLTYLEIQDQIVEPTYKESDHIYFRTLCSTLDVGICVEYMNRADRSEVFAEKFPDGCKPNIFLLHRPGHYDILYPKEVQQKDD